MKKSRFWQVVATFLLAITIVLPWCDASTQVALAKPPRPPKRPNRTVEKIAVGLVILDAILSDHDASPPPPPREYDGPPPDRHYDPYLDDQRYHDAPPPRHWSNEDRFCRRPDWDEPRRGPDPRRDKGSASPKRQNTRVPPPKSVKK